MAEVSMLRIGEIGPLSAAYEVHGNLQIDASVEMKRSDRKRLKALCVATCSFLSACAPSLPDINTANLASRSTINLSVRIVDGDVRSTAYTRGEGAVSGIGAGAGGALEAGLSSADPFGLALGVALVPVFATAGGIYGAASGTSRSREEIVRAVDTLNRAYQPSKFERAFEATLSNSLSTGLFDGVPPCFSTSSSRSSCPQGAQTSNLVIRTSFNLVPADSGAGSGNLDFIVQTLLTAEPKDVLQPECISLRYTNFAGNLFELAENNGQPMTTSLQSTLYDFAVELPLILRSAEADWGESSWTRLRCTE